MSRKRSVTEMVAASREWILADDIRDAVSEQFGDNLLTETGQLAVRGAVAEAGRVRTAKIRETVQVATMERMIQLERKIHAEQEELVIGQATLEFLEERQG